MERKERDSIEHLFEEGDVDEAVIAADDTGLVNEEHLITEAEIDKQLEDLEGGERPRD